MTMRKVAVTLDPEVLAAAEAAVTDGTARSVSAWLNKAAQHERSRHKLLIEFMDELLEENGGPITDEETAWAKQILGV